MHIVERPEELESTLATARRVAAGAFGDDTLFLERLVTTPRHIEVQVLADHHGNVIHLGERECSLQRRHQKVIEEAPSPLLDGLNDAGATRARIGEAACQAARSVHYSGAGTVEFLVSDEAPDEFFFMEMNTRLQVEHPVTEMVTGIDLVEWQVRIAAGEELSVRQADVELNGHAVEARVYAETPERNFMPSGGEVVFLDERGATFTAADSSQPGVTAAPAEPDVRIDSSLVEGLHISSDYDPMVAKVIAWGADRKAALAKLDAALARYTVLGIDTNVEYLRLLINDDDVRAGRLDTGLIERRMPHFTFRRTGDEEIIAAAVPEWVTAAAPANVGSPWGSTMGWRLGVPAAWTRSFAVPGGGMATVALTWAGKEGLGHVTARINGGPEHDVVVLGLTGHDVFLSIDGDHVRYARVSSPAAAEGPDAVRAVHVVYGGWSCRLEELTRESRIARVLAALEREEGIADPEVRSPMPGTVVSVAVSNGDAVEAGQVLLSVEAMKMEHQLVAEVAGTVHTAVKAGDLVKADQVLATIHAAAAEPVAHPATNPLNDPDNTGEGA
jgi:acetyl-CoA/propionyl-CoA carboxylase biotin carboxyl carrier protein